MSINSCLHVKQDNLFHLAVNIQYEELEEFRRVRGRGPKPPMKLRKRPSRINLSSRLGSIVLIDRML